MECEQQEKPDFMNIPVWPRESRMTVQMLKFGSGIFMVICILFFLRAIGLF